MADREPAEIIEADAARWVWRLEQAPNDGDLRARLDEWLAGDPRRAGAFLQAEAGWATIDRLRQLEDDRADPPLEKRKAPRAWRYAAVAAGLLALAVAAAGILTAPDERYATRTGEIRRLALQDGSALVLNTASRVDVVWRPESRAIRLSEGEAWFHVAHSSRPFVVSAGDLRVRALGTAFSVRLGPGGAEVRVTDGVVETWSADVPEARLKVGVGQQATLPPRAMAPEVETAAQPSVNERKLAWREGKIDLSGDTLEEAAAEFNRYNSRPLVIEDPALTRRRVYGLFDVNDPEAFARAVNVALQTGVRIRSDKIEIGEEPP